MLNNLTIVIPTYNRNDFLVKLLKSISTKVKNVKIRDNGSFVTQEIINSFPNYTFNSNSEIVPMLTNWNKCIDDIDTEYFVIPSDDDLFIEDSFEKIEAVFREFPKADVYIFGHRIINEKDEVTGIWAPSTKVMYNSPLGFDMFKYGVDARFPSIIFKTKLVRELGKFDESYMYVAGDSLLIQKCLLFGKSVYIPGIISSYRVWSNNLTSTNVSSLDWLTKVDRWQDEVYTTAVVKYQEVGLNYNKNKIKDEVYARNLIGGLRNLSSNFKAKFEFFKTVRYPYYASVKTQLYIIKSLLLN